MDDCITRIPARDNPLSADVFIIKGNEYTYIVDVGSNTEALDAINAIPKKKIIITHFHADHAENLIRIKQIDSKDLFVGDYTAKYYGVATVINEPLHIDDGVNLDILKLPSSHAKGCLTVIVNKNQILLGDGCYCNIKGYNVSLLNDAIKVLSEAEYNVAIKSHDSKIYTKEELISELKSIYALREKDNPFISWEVLERNGFK